MSLFARLMNRSDKGAVRVEPPVTASVHTSGTEDPAGWFVDGWHSGQSRVKTLPRVTPETAQRHATVFACCNIIAGDLAKVPLRVVEKDKKTGRKVPVQEHALDYLLNVESTFGVPAILTRMNAVYAFALRGNGYAYGT